MRDRMRGMLFDANAEGQSAGKMQDLWGRAPSADTSEFNDRCCCDLDSWSDVML